MCKRTILAAGLLLLPGCVHRTETLELKDLPVASVRRVGFVPFTAVAPDSKQFRFPSYPRVTAEWVAFRLAETGRVTVVTAEQAELAFRDAKISWPADGDPAPDTVRAAAALLRCDALVGGWTDRVVTGQSEFGVTLRVWDGASGRLAGTATAYTGFILASSDYPVMRQAAARAAECLAEGLLGEPLPSPARAQGDD